MGNGKLSKGLDGEGAADAAGAGVVGAAEAAVAGVGSVEAAGGEGAGVGRVEAAEGTGAGGVIDCGFERVADGIGGIGGVIDGGRIGLGWATIGLGITGEGFA